jgi:hypothetical protein
MPSQFWNKARKPLAGALTDCTAACIAGTNPERIERRRAG